MPYKDLEKRRACWKRYQQTEKSKANKRAWNERNREKTAAKQRARYDADPEKYSTYFRNRHLIKTYGINSDRYEEMFRSQGGVCAICGGEPNIERHGISRLAIDHCHATEKVRGLLCNHCNVMLGMIDDDIGLLESAIRYLKKHVSKEA